MENFDLDLQKIWVSSMLWLKLWNLPWWHSCVSTEKYTCSEFFCATVLLMTQNFNSIPEVYLPIFFSWNKRTQNNFSFFLQIEMFGRDQREKNRETCTWFVVSFHFTWYMRTLQKWWYSFNLWLDIWSFTMKPVN